MSVPLQVQRATERANELMNQANTAEAVADQPAAPVEPTPEAHVEPAPAPAPEPAPAEPAAEPVQAAPDANWEHKYRTLQGVFNAEKRATDARIQALEAQLAARPTPAPAPAPAAPVVTGITDKDRETYGDDLLDVISRQAAQMAEGIVAAKMAELQPQLTETSNQVKNVAQQVYQSKEAEFYGELAKAVPDWEAVNADQRWLDWLGTVDELSNLPRQAYLDNASQSLDHARAAKLFSAFKATIAPAKPAVVPPAPALSPSPRPVGAANAPKHVEPDTSVKRSDIAAHYRRVSTNAEYRASDERKAFEARLNQAMASNQIVEA